MVHWWNSTHFKDYLQGFQQLNLLFQLPGLFTQELFRGLKDRGKPTDLVFYPREGHGINEYYHQQDRLARIHAWVTSHVIGDGAKPPTPRQ